MRDRVRVLMVGPGPTGQGGIATVVSVLLRYGNGLADLRCVPTHVDGSAADRLRVWLTGSARAAGLLLTRRVDVVHAHLSERGSVLRKGLLLLLARGCRVPVLLHCHGAEFEQWFRGLPGPVAAAVAAVLRRADLLAVLGTSWRDGYVDLLGVPPDRVAVVGNAVALPERLPDRSGQTEVNALFLGRFGHRKGSADLLAALAALPPASRDALRLRMAGDGEIDRTRQLAAPLGSAVWVSGWLGPRERDAALAGAEVFVLPSRHEGLPMALLEAMGWGLVPVVTPVGSIPEVVRDGVNGLLVEPGDVTGLAKALDRLVTDGPLRRRLAAAARQTALDFDAPGYATRMAGHWSRLAARRG